MNHFLTLPGFSWPGVKSLCFLQLAGAAQFQLCQVLWAWLLAAMAQAVVILSWPQFGLATPSVANVIQPSLLKQQSIILTGTHLGRFRVKFAIQDSPVIVSQSFDIFGNNGSLSLFSLFSVKKGDNYDGNTQNY